MVWPREPLPDIPGFQLLHEIGRGGLGVVYRAREIGGDRDIALKLVSKEHAGPSIQRVGLEADIGLLLEHPDIVRTYGAGETDREMWIAMEILEGTPLDERLHAPDFSFTDRLRTLIRVALALQYAHEKGVIHRDVKPDNIFLTFKNEVKLLDFGIARVRDVRLTRTGSLVGTPSYMSPEQITGKEITWSTDLFSLGVVAYELFTEQRPWPGNEPYTLLVAISSQPPRPFRAIFTPRPWLDLSPAVISHLHRIIHRAIASEPQLRQRSLLEFAAELQDLVDHPDGNLPNVEVNVDPNRWADRKFDWAVARAARMTATPPADASEPERPELAVTREAIAPRIEPAPAPLLQHHAPPPAPEHEPAMLVWFILGAIFLLGLGTAVYYLGLGPR